MGMVLLIALAAFGLVVAASVLGPSGENGTTVSPLSSQVGWLRGAPNSDAHEEDGVCPIWAHSSPQVPSPSRRTGVYLWPTWCERM